VPRLRAPAQSLYLVDLMMNILGNEGPACGPVNVF